MVFEGDEELTRELQFLEVSMTWAITKRPTMAVASTYDPRNTHEYPSQRILAGAKQEGTENEAILVRLVKAFEKWEAGPLVDKSEIVFIEYELQAAIQAFHQAHAKEK